MFFFGSPEFVIFICRSLRQSMLMFEVELHVKFIASASEFTTKNISSPRIIHEIAFRRVVALQLELCNLPNLNDGQISLSYAIFSHTFKDPTILHCATVPANTLKYTLS